LRPRAVIATLIALLASVFWLTVMPCTPAQGAMNPTTVAHAPRTDASAPTHAHDNGHDRQHKEGPVAVAASVIGIIVVVVCIVGLGSLSVRRRTRDRPPAGDQAQGGPPGRERGLFDEWFRTRR
jgi:4-amino-4-deoxy-L-arabinose transferase-like glycosyltransferase